MAEQHGSYAEAKVLFTQSLDLGLPNWWSHALPILGWALIGLEELDEARSYFQQILTQAEAQKRLPIMLDAQAGLAYVAILKGDESQLGGAKLGEKSGESVSCFQYIYQHSSTTQQTRTRIERLAVKWALTLTETSAG